MNKATGPGVAAPFATLAPPAPPVPTMGAKG
jgi:hypothetical protein